MINTITPKIVAFHERKTNIKCQNKTDCLINHSFCTVRGFTLIELMIVVAIIGVLSVVAYPTYTTSMAKAQQTTAMEKINEIAQEIERYITENRVLPPDAAAMGYSDIITNEYYTFTISTTDGDGDAYTITSTIRSGEGIEKKNNYRLNNLGRQEHKKYGHEEWESGWSGLVKEN